MARRVAEIVRLGASGLVVRGVAKVAVRAAATVVDVVGAMGAIGIVGAVRLRRRIAVRRARFRRLGVLVRAIMLLSTTRCWRLRRVRVEMKKRLVRVRRVLMVSGGGVGVGDVGGDAALRVRLRQRRPLGMRRMSLV